VPAIGQVAPELTPGFAYSYFAETTGAGATSGLFYMKGSEPIQTVIPDLCVTLVDKHEVRVNCGDNRPYVEPVDLERVALANRVRE
jgi:hypothetical protein